MEFLLDDYKRRLKTVETMLKENQFNYSDIERTRIETKASEYRSIIHETEKALQRVLNKDETVETKTCNCIKETAEKINKHVSERTVNPKGFKIIESEWENKSWYPKTRLYVNYTIKYVFEKKDGTISKPKNEHASIYFTYCPFCGKKME